VHRAPRRLVALGMSTARVGASARSGDDNNDSADDAPDTTATVAAVPVRLDVTIWTWPMSPG
jgi:hypothetical protein